MLLEADLIAKRATLRWFAQRHLYWTPHELAAVLQMSRSGVSKCLQRLHQADLHDVMALHGRSFARLTPPASIASQPAVVQRILETCVAPQRTCTVFLGRAEAIFCYLHLDASLKDAEVHRFSVPSRST